MLNKPRILHLSDSPLTVTGFATVSKDVCNYLSSTSKYDMHYVGHNYLGQTLTPGTTFEDNTKLKFTLHGMGREQYCNDIIEPLIKELKPQLFTVLLDTFMLVPPNANYLVKDLSPAKTVFYYPSDGGREEKGTGRLPLYCESILQKFGNSVAMSRFAQRQAEKVHGIKSHYIPHGVWTNIYFPLGQNIKDLLKQNLSGFAVTSTGQLAPANINAKNKFIVGSVYRNQGRKMADRQLKAFAKFAKDKDDVLFYLHSDPTDAAAVFNSIEFIKELGIQNKVLFSGMRYFKGFTVQKMREVYNLMDVFFLSTSGEGFGVPTLEAMSCGVPTIVTDYTTTQELLIEDGKCGEPVRVAEELIGTYNVPRAIMDTDDAAEKLNKLYHDRAYAKKLGEVGRKKAVEFYDYQRIIGPQWDKYFENILNE